MSSMRKVNLETITDTLTIRWNLAKPEKTYHEIIALQCLIDPRRMELPKEQCAEKKKGRLRCCCNVAWTKNGGQIPWNANGDMENHL